MSPVCAPAHPDQANQISGHHTITKEWSDVYGNHTALRQDNLGYYFLDSEQKHRRGRKETEGKKGLWSPEIGCRSTNLGQFL